MAASKLSSKDFIVLVLAVQWVGQSGFRLVGDMVEEAALIMLNMASRFGEFLITSRTSWIKLKAPRTTLHFEAASCKIKFKLWFVQWTYMASVGEATLQRNS